MAYLRQYCIFLCITIALSSNFDSVQCNEKLADVSLPNSANDTLSPNTPTRNQVENTSTSRAARALQMLNKPKRNRMPIKLQSRNDRFPLGPPKRFPVVYHRPPAYTPMRPQQQPQHQQQEILRRVQGAPALQQQQHQPQLQQQPQLRLQHQLQQQHPQQHPQQQLQQQQQQRLQSQRYHFDGPKSSRFSTYKMQSHYAPNGKLSNYRPQVFNSPNAGVQHPNAIAHAHQQQQQQQQPQQVQLQNQLQQQHQQFKASPAFNGQAILRPTHEQQALEHFRQQQQQQQAHEPYVDVKQYPLPQSPQQQQQGGPIYVEQYHEYQQPAMHWAYQQQAHQQQQYNVKPYKEAPLLQPANQQQSYAVYEDAEINEHADLSPYAMDNQALFQQQSYPQANHPEGVLTKEAQEYLDFMNSNDYFLPKHEPNYKEMDNANHNQQQQLQEQDQQYKYSKSLDTAASAYVKPIQVSSLFYQHDPTPNAAIVRGSYQTGNNLFVVNSDGNKGIKHIVASPLPPADVTTLKPTAAYAQVRYSAVRNRTPEPVRFEFTEHDAISGAHTNAPTLTHYKSPIIVTPTDNVSSTTPNTPTRRNYGSSAAAEANKKPLTIVAANVNTNTAKTSPQDKAESYGRVALNTSTSVQPTPVAQKDTEEYCERICANVHDDDEEIVCGSDGYMYTGEAQMECYASCLHIDVTIQSKGSCADS